MEHSMSPGASTPSSASQALAADMAAYPWMYEIEGCARTTASQIEKPTTMEPSPGNDDGASDCKLSRTCAPQVERSYAVSRMNFSVEIEIPLKVELHMKSIDDSDRALRERGPGGGRRFAYYQAAIHHLTTQFSLAGLHAHGEALLQDTRSKREWSITIDETMDVKDDFGENGILPCEIISPIMNISKEPHYKVAFGKMWQTIWPSCLSEFDPPNYEFWKGASTHIHFSLPAGDEAGDEAGNAHGQFPIDIAKKIAFCAVYFERVIDDIMPGMTDEMDDIRKEGWKGGNEYCQRNRVRPGLRSIGGFDWLGGMAVDDLAHAWAGIRDCKNMADLANVMCCGYRNPTLGIGPSKYFKWSFVGPRTARYATIEFRQMPPCHSPQQTFDWISFLSYFVAAAEQVDTTRLDQAGAGKTTFTEALGLRLRFPVEVVRIKEKAWCSDVSHTFDIDWPIWRLRNFVIGPAKAAFGNRYDDGVWSRLLGLKARIEQRLMFCGAVKSEKKRSDQRHHDPSWV